MKLIGNLKKKVENAETKEEVRDAFEKAGMLLDDEELENVSGGSSLKFHQIEDMILLLSKKVTSLDQCMGVQSIEQRVQSIEQREQNLE